MCPSKAIPTLFSYKRVCIHVQGMDDGMPVVQAWVPSLEHGTLLWEIKLLNFCGGRVESCSGFMTAP